MNAAACHCSSSRPSDATSEHVTVACNSNGFTTLGSCMPLHDPGNGAPEGETCGQQRPLKCQIAELARSEAGATVAAGSYQSVVGGSTQHASPQPNLTCLASRLWVSHGTTCCDDMTSHSVEPFILSRCGTAPHTHEKVALSHVMLIVHPRL